MSRKRSEYENGKNVRIICVIREVLYMYVVKDSFGFCKKNLFNVEKIILDVSSPVLNSVKPFSYVLYVL